MPAKSRIGSARDGHDPGMARAERQLTAFRTFLILWCAWICAHFVYVQSSTNWGANQHDMNLANPWDPTWFGVFNATVVLVPFVVFQLPIAMRYGGWSSSIGRALLAFGIGTVLWGFGNFYWFLKNVSGDDAPYPSLADAGYLAVLPFAAWALWELSRVVGLTKRDWQWLPLALLVAFPLNAWIMLPASKLPFGLTGPEAGTFDTPLAGAISSTYIISDVVLLGVAILVAIGARRAAGGRFLAPVLAYTVSIFLLYIGDIFFNYRIAKEIFYNGEISDLLYGAFIICSSWAAYLFLVADVRAARAVAAADREWAPATTDEATQVDEDAAAMTPLQSIPTAMLAAQERVLGKHVARSLFRAAPGIELDEESSAASAVDAIAIDALVREIKSLAGPLGEMACWTATRGILDRNPQFELASLERFRDPNRDQAAAASSSSPSSDGKDMVAAADGNTRG